MCLCILDCYSPGGSFVVNAYISRRGVEESERYSVAEHKFKERQVRGRFSLWTKYVFLDEYVNEAA